MRLSWLPKTFLPAHPLLPRNRECSRNCPLCSHDNLATYHSWSEFDLLLCIRCGFRFVDIHAVNYPQNAQSIFDETGIGPINPDQSHIRRRVSDILKFAKPPGTALDIGCGKGEVSLLLARQGFRCVGIDMKTSLIEHLRQNFPDVSWRQLRAEELIGTGERFDVITLYHVVEHIPDFISALSLIKQMAKPGALMVIEVPNVGGWQARLMGTAWHYYKVDHVNYFRRQDLISLARRLNAEPLGVKGYQHFSYPQNIWWKDTIKRSLAVLGFQDVISIFMRLN